MKKQRTHQRFLGILLTGFLAGTTAWAAPFEKSVEYRFPDGVTLKVHYEETVLAAYAAPENFPSQVLDAAVSAYQTLTQFEGFNTPGYSFAQPDRAYAYDPDKTIDIYLGSPAGDSAFDALGARNQMFKDSPCFDTLPMGNGAYQAVVLLPANYREFIKNWEKINPSPMGRRNLEVDLRGTLIHEMLHVIIFYYNKNLNKAQGNEASAKDLDWYVEGLARYFETFAGARHDFFSQGFKQRLPDKIRFSRGGSNYFMRYPDQPFTQLRYENALFWRYMDHRFGMESIEALSRHFRTGRFDPKAALESVTGQPFDELLKDFAFSTLEKEFGLKEDAVYLNEIARTRLRYRDGAFALLDGEDRERTLGARVTTDWIGRWEDQKAQHGSASIAGDSTDEADVSGWATDFIRLELDARGPRLPRLRLHHEGDGRPLEVQVLCVSKGGAVLRRSWPMVLSHRFIQMDLDGFVHAHGLDAADIDHLMILITNTDPSRKAFYSLEAVS